MFCGDATCAMTYPGTWTAGPILFYNNILWNGYNGTTDISNGHTVRSAAMSILATCSPTSGPSGSWLNIIANNITVSAEWVPGALAYMVTSPGNNCTSQTFKNNDWYPLAGNVAFSGYNQGGMSSVAAWNAASGDTGVSTNPNFANGGGGASTICYTAGSGVPGQPGTIPCPTNYELQHGSALIAAQDGLNNEIAPSLTAQELQTVREALWKREADLVRHYPDHLTEPTVFQQMAFNHLLNGGALRAGDFTALHGALLSALQPNTYALAKRWQHLMDCYLNSAECPTN